MTLQNHVNKLSTSIRRPNGLAFKNYTILYMYIAQGQGQITPWHIISPQFWLYRKKVTDHPRIIWDYPRIIIWTNLVDLESPILFTKIPPRSFLGSGGEDFKSVNYIWALRPSCSVVQSHFNKLSITLQQTVPCEICLNWSSGFREEDSVYMLIAQRQRQITPRTKFWF